MMPGYCSPRHRPGSRRSSSRTRGVGPDCHSSATGRGGRRTLSPFPKEKDENAPPRRFSKNIGMTAKKRRPAPVAGDFCAYRKETLQKKRATLQEKIRALRKKKQTSALREALVPFFSRRRFLGVGFFFPSLCSSLAPVGGRPGGETCWQKRQQLCIFCTKSTGFERK